MNESTKNEIEIEFIWTVYYKFSYITFTHYFLKEIIFPNKIDMPKLSQCIDKIIYLTNKEDSDIERIKINAFEYALGILKFENDEKKSLQKIDTNQFYSRVILSTFDDPINQIAIKKFIEFERKKERSYDPKRCS